VSQKKVNESLFLIHKTITLIEYYNFDLGKYQIQELITKWSRLYPCEWLPIAVLEALYEGRIKTISVEEILNLWQKKGEAILLFNSEFEKLITHNLNLDDFDLAKTKEIFEHLFIPQDTIKDEGMIEKLSSIMNFQPVEDSSHCFNKLKSFLEIDEAQND